MDHPLVQKALGYIRQIPPVPEQVQLGFAAIGALYLGSKLLSYLSLLLSAFVFVGHPLRRYGRAGSWAVVTGASDGLGKEYAMQLAAKGFNLVLVSRTQSKLDTLAKEIEQKYPGKGLQVKTLAMDFAKNDDRDYDLLRELIRGLDIAVLINNVGQSHSIPVSFIETPKEELENIVTINCIGTLKVTQIVAPVLKARKHGLILTMGSFGGWTPTPYLATYSGSKAFLQQWSNALASELADDHVDVYLVLSHLVTTAMSKVRRPSLLIPNARNFVKSALGKIGLGGYQTAPNTYTPWWSHAVMLWLIENVPGVNSPITIWYNKKMHVDIRKRALRKREREAKKQ
ncbi:hypothetical protein PLIIFM63780_003895 [Purpureocillium lilacinum]|nr:hypothetical protein PLICBS_000446 [Purpureocillium lilacinum]GJN80369.1 hypothetical protein PLIIFM63780_003895 [Purpureocillium lilacinum]